MLHIPKMEVSVAHNKFDLHSDKKHINGKAAQPCPTCVREDLQHLLRGRVHQRRGRVRPSKLLKKPHNHCFKLNQTLD